LGLKFENVLKEFKATAGRIQHEKDDANDPWITQFVGMLTWRAVEI